MTEPTFPPLFLVDVLRGFRISNGVVTLSFGLIRADYETDGKTNTATLVPLVDVAMGIATLEGVMQLLQAKLEQGKAVAQMQPAETVQ